MLSASKSITPEAGSTASVDTSHSVVQTFSTRLDCIDALRGIACLWVMIHHSLRGLSGSTHSTLPWFAAFIQIGWLGVSLFLVLSGFCLYYPLVKRHGVKNAQVNLKAFAQKRCRRILPPYLISLVLFSLCGLFSKYTHHPLIESEFTSWKDVVAHVFMIHNLNSTTFASINAAYWSLALEFQLYIVFPVFVCIAARRGLGTVVVFALFCSMIWQIIAYKHFGLTLKWTPQVAVVYHALPARCFEFVMGMVAATVVANCKPRHVTIAAMLIGILALPALWFVLQVSRFGPLCDQIWGIIFASCIVLLARIPNGHFERIPLLAAVVWLGTISYSVYLLHVPLIILFDANHFHLHLSNPLAVTGFILARLILIMPIGYAFYCACEKPFITHPAQRKTVHVF